MPNLKYDSLELLSNNFILKKWGVGRKVKEDWQNTITVSLKMDVWSSLYYSNDFMSLKFSKLKVFKITK